MSETDTTDEAKWEALKAEDRRLGDPFTGARLEPEPEPEDENAPSTNYMTYLAEDEERDDDVYRWDSEKQIYWRERRTE